MTDKQYQRAINKTLKKMKEYKALLQEVEEEYYNRYGHFPSDLNNDTWIDSMHIDGSPLTVDKIEESAKLCNEINK